MSSPPLDYLPALAATSDVYAPQHDSELLVESMRALALPAGQRVADSCTGSGFVAVSAARAAACTVRAFDVSIAAVRCARANAFAAGVNVRTHLGNCSRAIEFGPFDLVLCNPPYVPQPPCGDAVPIPRSAGPLLAVDGGSDGRLVLDPLCEAAPEFIRRRGNDAAGAFRVLGYRRHRECVADDGTAGVGDRSAIRAIRPCAHR